MWDIIIELANAGWNLWLLILFVIVVAYALWPSKRRQKQMDAAARIPFEDDEYPKSGAGSEDDRSGDSRPSDSK